MSYLDMWKFFCIFVKLLFNMVIIIREKNVSDSMNVEYTYTNLYITNLAFKQL